MMLKPSLHEDSFARDNLPPPETWPELHFDLPSLNYPDRLNCVERLLDEAVAEAGASRPAILHGEQVLTYGELAATVNRFCRVLVDDLGVRSGARVLLRGGNTPQMFAAWLAVIKVGAIAVATMPLLRAGELRQVLAKAQVGVALCECGLLGELAEAAAGSRVRVVTFGEHRAELEHLAVAKPADFTAVPTSQDDVCLIAFTSGTTGEPKAAMHFHRDVLAMCDTFAAHILPRVPDAVFSGTPPIAFTFGLGALLVFPLYFRAAIALPMSSAPSALAECVRRHRVTHVFTSPTGYRAMLAQGGVRDMESLKACVSAGEQLPAAVSEAWFAATGLRLIDGIGSTEMIHIFISAAGDDIRPGSTGRPVPGYTAALLEPDGTILEGAGVGRLAIRGPTGCRYLSDPRQTDYVQGGWNVTGDIFRRDDDGYYWYVARADDMIVSSGYNIAGPEVEAALMLHPLVHECAVVGWPDAERGQLVKAVVVLKDGAERGEGLVRELQEHVKSVLAPYKYPRIVEFRQELPKTATGKLRRSALRARSAEAVV